MLKHGGANNVRHGYDAAPLPRGVLAIGDAVVALNPVSAWSAVLGWLPAASGGGHGGLQGGPEGALIPGALSE